MENVKTVALSGAETRIEIGGSHCHIRNDSSNVIYAAKKPGLTAGEDGVLSVPVGGSAVLYGIAGEVYLTGAGNIQLVGSDYAESPFKSAPGAGGGSVTKAAVITALGYTPASLNAVGVVPAEELPSYIDDIVVKDTADDFPVTGESGVIYLALDTGINYRWTDAGYEEIPDIFGLAMGEYIGASGTIENTVEAPAFVTDFPINLFKPLNSNITRDGITLSYDKKTGKISVAGTPTSNYVQININYELNKKVVGTGDYVLSGGTSDVQIRLFTKTSGGLERAFISTGEPTACKITDEHTTTWLAITVTSGANIAPSHTELYPILVKGDRYRDFIPYGGGTIKTIGQNGEENELFLSPNTILPAAGLKTFDGVTNVISDFEVSLAYYKNKQQSVPIKAVENDFVQKPKANTFEINPIFPTNIIRYDNIGEPSVMVRIPKFKLSDVIDGASDTVHPAFIVNGTEIPWIEISKYQNTVETGRAYSRAGADPKTDINFDSARSACEAKGAGWHLMTNAEWAAIALWCKKNGFMPKGNNNLGKDETEDSLPQKALGTYYGNDGKINRTATGSGPVSWYHDNTSAGIADLNGNVWEWVNGFRLKNGEIQIIEDNNAAINGTDVSDTGGLWKAIDTSGALAAPGSAGTLKYKSGVISTDAGATDDFDFDNITAAEGVTIPELMKALALAPDGAGHENDHVWINANGERIPVRGGCWFHGERGGVFTVSLYPPRSNTGADVGFRSAYYEP